MEKKHITIKKYTSSVYEAVKNYYAENEGKTLTEADINKLDRSEVLEAYLSWEGIYGYTSVICEIMGA